MAETKSTGRKVERGIEGFLLASRWPQAPLYIGLVIVLAVIVVKFPFKAWELVRNATTVQEADHVVLVLSLVDVIMVANLVVMVIISGYDNFVSRIELGPEGERLAWFSRLDSGSLKVKLATSVVVISAIHLLQRFWSPATSTRPSPTRWSSCTSPSWRPPCFLPGPIAFPQGKATAGTWLGAATESRRKLSVDQPVELPGVGAGDHPGHLRRDVGELLLDELVGVRPHAVAVRVVGAPH